MSTMLNVRRIWLDAALPILALLGLGACQGPMSPAAAELEPEGSEEKSPTAKVDGRVRLEVEAAGARYPLTVNPLWTEREKLTASDGTQEDFFGSSVSVSGDTAIVGASGKTVGGSFRQGQAYVYVRSGTLWTEQARLTASDGEDEDTFGSSVAISGDTAVVGAPWKSIRGRATAGQAYVYVRTGTSWAEQATLIPSDGTNHDFFGAAVSISGDTVIVGAPSDVNPKLGLAYVYVRTGTSWKEQAKLSASDGAAQDLFGNAVSVSGDTALVGASRKKVAGHAGQGQAYVYVRTGASWAEQATLSAADGAANDAFGASVSVSGDAVLIGALAKTVGGNARQGQAYLYRRTGTSWKEQAKLSAADGAANDAFGASVSVSGDIAVVGAFDKGIGGKPSQGQAYFYKRAGSSWTEQARLLASDGAANDWFGQSVSVSGDIALVGAPAKAVGGSIYQGQACLFPSLSLLPDGAFCTRSAACRNGNCVDGVCCDTTCGGGALDCQACSVAAGAPRNGTCAPAKAGTTCRPAAGACDASEVCDGMATTCPADGVKPSTSQCRPAAGPCDTIEFCTGTSKSCPANKFKPAGLKCRDVAGPCDVAEQCSGTGADCPTDQFKPNTTVCRASAGSCDLTEFCSGSGPACPPDLYKPLLIMCRPAVGGCDLADYCTGMSPACPPDDFLPAGTTCRPAMDACDADEQCSGTSAVCPWDRHLPDGTACPGGLCQAGMCI